MVWIWAGLMTHFNNQNVMEETLCKFESPDLKRLPSFYLPLWTCVQLLPCQKGSPACRTKKIRKRSKSLHAAKSQYQPDTWVRLSWTFQPTWLPSWNLDGSPKIHKWVLQIQQNHQYNAQKHEKLKTTVVSKRGLINYGPHLVCFCRILKLKLDATFLSGCGWQKSKEDYLAREVSETESWDLLARGVGLCPATQWL